MAERDPLEEVSALVEAGRLDAAARALKASARSGTEPWEVFVWLGRIEERRARPAEAERAFRRAIEAEPESPYPHVELARLLETQGKSDEALDALRAPAARGVAELPRADAALLRLLEFNLYRRAFLEALARSPARAESAASALDPARGGAGTRTLRADALAVLGRLDEAEAELASAFAAGGPEAATSRVECLLGLAGRGRCGPGLERAVLGAAARGPASDRLLSEWTQVFSVFMCAGLYAQAFRLGEAVLDRLGRIDDPGRLLWPWWPRVRRAVAEERFLADERARLEHAARGGPLEHWFSYYRAVLLSDSGREGEAMREYERVRGLDPGRYSWMLQSFVLAKLGLRDFDGTAEVCRAVLARHPSHWWVRCLLAEALLVGGDEAGALGEFERALALSGPLERREVLTWHGEVLLWLGRYDEALARLDEAVALGARTFVFGWRGAARLKRGDVAAALEDLDRAIVLDPKDLEARGWRAEALHALGRDAQALGDLDHAIRVGPYDLWMHVVRSLVRDALGDARGAAEDFGAVSAEAADFLRRGLGLPPEGDLDPGERRRVLEAALERARGLRRWENYVQPVWMGRRT